MSRRLDRRRLGAYLVLIIVASAPILGSVPGEAATYPETRASTAHLVDIGIGTSAPAGSRLIGSLANDAPMSIELMLPPRSGARLSQDLTAITTPGSKEYRHFLPRGAFATQFGATTQSIDAVRSGLARLGLTHSSVNANDLAVLVSTTSGVLSRALHLRLLNYESSQGREFIVPSQAPSLPLTLASHVSTILGLNTEDRVIPAGLGRTTSPNTSHSNLDVAGSYSATDNASCEAQINASHAGFTPDQIADAYDMSPLYAEGDLGSGVSIGVIEFSPFASADINTYAACLGVTASVNVAPVDGGPQTTGGDDKTVDQDSAQNTVEAELDLEDLIGLAPGASIFDYEGASRNGQVSGQAAYDTYAAAINADVTQVISSSWGTCEAATDTAMVSAENTIFEQAALQGQTVVAASGDDGSEDCSGGSASGNASNSALAVDDPASQPYVTGVGGTTLTIAPSRSEVVWNTGRDIPFPAAGGGGVSSNWAMPRYQADASPALGVTNAGIAARTCERARGCRLVPDVALNAGSPYAVYCSLSICSGWTGLVGTSGAAPTFAAMIALADDSAACASALPPNSHSLGFVNPALYAIASGPNGSKAFIDITSGENDVLGVNAGDYGAGPGYDLASGLGAPVAGNGIDTGLVADLCSTSTFSDVVATGGLALPKVTGLSPNLGLIGGGERVAITGTNLEGAEGVLFGTTPAQSFREESPTRIVAVAPPGTGKTHVTVITRAGTAPTVRKGIFAFDVAPVIDRLAPPRGPTSGMNVVVIVGTGLNHVTSVRFGKIVTHSFAMRSSTRLKVIVPAGHGIVKVTVTTRVGTSQLGMTTRYRYR